MSNMSTSLVVGVHGGAAQGGTSDLRGTKCCVCLEEVDYRGTTLIECGRCKIHVHVKCYGLSVPTDGSTWLCEPCKYMAPPLPETAQATPKTEPFCIVCPCAGGALRQTNQPGVWCHVLCMNWIPELSHSLSGEMNEVLDIRLLDRSRESLKCKICGQKGGCIQCVSGRCARPFHVICAMRSPSTAFFTGYNNDNQQVYHCTSHLSDIATFKYEMVDDSWKKSPILLKFLAESPESNNKCRVCGNKMPSNHLDRHEKLCLIGWLAKEEMRIRRKQIELAGSAYPKIDYSRGSHGGGGKSNTPSKSSSKNRKNGPPTRPCPQCGELVRETLMMGHMKNNCKKTRGSAKRAKNPAAMNRQHSADHETETVDLTQDSDPASAAQDLVDVLYATWPGQSAGSLLDSTNFWRILNNNFFSNKVLLKKRMEPLCKNLCGARLEDMGDFSQKSSSHDSINCTDTVLFARSEDSASLEMKSIVHRCDFMMRGSRTRCLDDLAAKSVIEIRHGPELSLVSTESTDGMQRDEGELAVGDDARSVVVQIKNTEGDCVSCRYGFHVNHPSAANQAADVWTRYHPDAVSTVVGAGLENGKPALPDEAKLWISLHELQDLPSAESDHQRDELTPELSLLIEKLREQMRQNRYRVRSLCRKTQQQDQREGLALKEKTTIESYYREFALWKALCKSLLVGYREFWKAKPEEEADTSGKTSPGGSSNDEAEGEPVDDGTCVVCFDGQSPESNPIIFCDRCDLAVHQRCYGIQHVPNNEFYCDRCRLEDSGQDSASNVYCQLCPLRDGAFKKTIDGKWVHVVCALWCPGVWIGNLQTLSDIKLVDSAHRTRFVDTIKEVNALINPQAQELSATTPGISRERSLRHGSLCQYCRVACGRTIQCCHPGCSVSFHPLCSWFEGYPMTVNLDASHGYIYSGGGNGLSFTMVCGDHMPDECTPELRIAQAKNRRRFRIDSFFVSQSKLQPVPVRGSGGTITRSAASPDESCGLDVWTDRELCAACFDYSSPVPADLQDNSLLNKRQLMMRCQYCNTFIHAACCLSEIDDVTDLFRSNWICERCTLVDRSKQIAVTACVVCDRSSDYMMPCVSLTAGTSVDASGATNPTNGSQSDRWIHVLCAKMTKTKSIKRHHMLCASQPVLAPETNGRCDLCQMRGRNLASCGGCSKRFHPTCAARKKFYVSRSSKAEWKFLCPSHPPVDVAYDEKRQAWFTGEILAHLHELRLMLERGRMIIEMARQRDRQKKRMLNLCSVKKMELSMEMILKKRPTPFMKETYQEYTGEDMEDVPKRPTPAPSRSGAAASKSRGRARGLGDEEEETRKSSRRSSNTEENDQAHAALEDTPRKRRRVHMEEAETTPSRRSSRRTTTAEDDDDFEVELASPSGRPVRGSTRHRPVADASKHGDSVDREPRRRRNRVLDLSPDPFDLSTIPAKLLRVTRDGDFDDVIPDSYPEMIS